MEKAAEALQRINATAVADGKNLYSQELSFGPVYSVALSKDGTQILLGCGPRDRQQPASEAYAVPMPVK